MGGLPCAKTIIDQRNGVVRAMDCMATSILLTAPSGSYPTDEMQDEFVKAANALAMVAAKIEKHAREGGGLNDYDHDDKGGKSIDGKPRPPRGEGL